MSDPVKYTFREDAAGRLFATQASAELAPWQSAEGEHKAHEVPLDAIAKAAAQRASWGPLSRKVVWSVEELQEQAEARAERRRQAEAERQAQQLRAQAKHAGKPLYGQERFLPELQAGTSAARTCEEAQEPEAARERTLVWIDTETGGTDPHEHPLLEIAALQTSADASKVLSSWFYAKVKPDLGQWCTKKALETNGINPKDPAWLKDALEVEEMADLFLAWLPGEMPVLAGHNVAFDQRFLNAALEKRGVKWITPTLDTLPMARKLRGTVLAAKQKCGLSDLCSHFGIALDNQHTAKADARRAILLYRKLRDLEVNGSLLAVGGEP